MCKSLFALSFLVSIVATAQVPSQWKATGIGGGGALFAPTINPANNNEFCISSDLSAMYHTTDAGKSYNIYNAQQIQGFHNSTVRFTSTPGLLYSINYANNAIVPVKSTDNGITWTTLAGTPDLFEEAYSIYADYNNPTHIVLSYYGDIFFSNNGGNTFTNIHNAVSNGAGCLIGGVFFNGSNIYIGTNDGIVYSTNSGGSFSIMSTTGIRAGEALFSFCGAKEGGTTRFFCVTGNNGDVYNGLQGSDYYGFTAGIYKMDNANGTWVSCKTGIDTANDFLMFAAMAENDIDTCYLAGSNSNGNPNIMRTGNGGTNWSHVFNTANNANIVTGWCGQGGDKQWSWAECPFGFAVSPNNSKVALFGDYSMVTRTTDGGATWKQAYVDPADEHAANATTPFKQTYKSVGMENTACWQVYWVDSLNMYGAYTDIFAIRSEDAGETWSFNYSYTPSNTVYRIAPNVSTPSTLYAATSTIHDMYQSYRLTDNVIDGGGGKIIYSTDGGDSWKEMHNFGAPVYWVATDQQHADIAYASVVKYANSTGGIYKCSNLSAGAASTWTKLTNPPRTEGHPATIEVLSNGNVLCSFSGRRSSNQFTQSAGVFLYNPTGDTWTDVSSNELKYYTRSVIADPNGVTQQTWYASVFSGYGGTGNDLGGVYKTTNGGTNWTRIFDEGDVFSCTFSPTNPDLLFVCTDGIGLWTSSNINNASPSFSRIGSYYFANPVRVSFNPYKQNEVWVATFGYGMNVGSFSSTGTGSFKAINNTLKVYPNPSQGEFRIDFDFKSNTTIEVRDITGKSVIKPIVCPSSKHSCLLDLTALAKGTYTLSVISENETAFSKLIIQ